MGALPLVPISALSPSLSTNEFIGAEVRSSDDKIIGEVRNVIFETDDHPAHAIVASGGFFTPGEASIVAPVRSLKATQDRSVFSLPCWRWR